MGFRHGTSVEAVARYTVDRECQLLQEQIRWSSREELCSFEELPGEVLLGTIVLPNAS